MANIVAALFGDFKTAEAAVQSLRGEGSSAADTNTFAQNAENRRPASHFPR